METQAFADERLINIIKLIPIPGSFIVYVPVWKENTDPCRCYKFQEAESPKMIGGDRA